VCFNYDLRRRSIQWCLGEVGLLHHCNLLHMSLLELYGKRNGLLMKDVPHFVILLLSLKLWRRPCSCLSKVIMGLLHLHCGKLCCRQRLRQERRRRWRHIGARPICRGMLKCRRHGHSPCVLHNYERSGAKGRNELGLGRHIQACALYRSACRWWRMHI